MKRAELEVRYLSRTDSAKLCYERWKGSKYVINTVATLLKTCVKTNPEKNEIE